MKSEITLTKEGGFYYRAMTVHVLFVATIIVPALLVTILALINPFWFRQAMFQWVERKATKLARWRDRIKYRAYLGTDPEVWHALKDNNER